MTSAGDGDCRSPRSIRTGLAGFGFVFAFGSSLGWAFFISLFVPGIAQDLSLSLPLLATAYASATIASALCLPRLCRLLDRVDFIRFGLWVAMALAAGSFILAAANAVWMVVAGLFVLRPAGQGLTSHVA